MGLKEDHERAVGNKFIAWYNKLHGTSFEFDHVPAQAPDLVFKDGPKEISIEIVTAYYDGADATALWTAARKKPQPAEWAGLGPDAKLIAGINSSISAKCAKQYAPGTTLIVHVRPSLTTWLDFKGREGEVRTPTGESNPFKAIYLSGDFPASRDEPQGYHCTLLYSRSS
jgi:hypothetical protein